MFKKTIKFLGVRVSLLLLVLILLVAAAVFGLMLGYGVLGGGNPTHIFDRGLWHEVLNKLNPK
ncbi:DNA-directed RNA polymerase subunit beta [Lactococcus hircilactis]|uniref:DNA-directed RNA polymerase subunit beta n=1 Tax=Lactococcus hircilactis TaxID=1494462 RepID=A0A7X2D025_9LACT|nr:DNA-directed RNA polymerase subunit beta [Lactococcus hircilactis]MQW39294.1 DNA-directed RNA polymerase subunit beta [Lactococcus hircilactis]